jgi:hypothetical protein
MPAVSAQEIVRSYLVGKLSYREFHEAMTEVPGPSSNAWLALCTQFENSDWDEDEFKRHVHARLSEGS